MTKDPADLDGKQKAEGGDDDTTDVPNGLKRAFRKWDDNLVGRCKVFDLQDALEGCS